MQKDYGNKDGYLELINKLHPAIYRENYFHSIIDLNLIKLDLILKHGILSKRNMGTCNINVLHTHDSNDFDSKNGDDYVSVTKYDGEERQTILFSSFAMHTLSSISLAINDSIDVSRVGDRETYFDDEFFVFGEIKPERFTGILVPDHLVSSRISEIVSTSNDLGNFTGKSIDKWIRLVEKYFETKVDRQKTFDSVDTLWDILKECEAPERWVGSALEHQKTKFGEDLRDILSMTLQLCWDERIGKQGVNVLDVINYLNGFNLPVYDIKGYRLNIK